MKRLIAVFGLVLLAGAPAWAAPRAGGYATMHNEKESPRPTDVTIAGARPDQVVLYCTTLSAGCKGLRAHLAKRGIDPLDKELTTDSVAQAEFEALGGLGVPLVVFKDRMLHGYYPSGFERVYAQQASGQVAQRTADAGAGQSRASAVDKLSQAVATPSGAAAGSASPVEVVAPAAIAAYIQSHPDVLVQFTSSDDRCGYCVAAYQGFDAAARSYGRAVKFVRVEWTPWMPFPKEVEALHDGGYAPVQIAYRSGKELARFDGSFMNKSREFGAFVKRTYGLGSTYPGSAVAIDEIEPEHLAAYLQAHPRAVIQFTSPDPNCRPCAAAYSAFEETAATHGKERTFARVQWLRWNHPPKDLWARYKPGAVPAILAFQDGEVLDRLVGTTAGSRLTAWIEALPRAPR